MTPPLLPLFGPGAPTRPTLPFGIRTCAAFLFGIFLAAAARAAAASAARALAAAQARAAAVRLSSHLQRAAGVEWESGGSHSSNSTSVVDLFGEVTSRLPRPGTPSSISSLDDETVTADLGIEPPGGEVDEPQIVYRVAAEAQQGGLAPNNAGEPSKQTRYS
jgi:hypothetical protein